MTLHKIHDNANNDYISTKRSSVRIPVAGDVVYGFAHLHSGGMEDRRVICLSKPIYGQGNSVGDEAGYVVGMLACYPKPESSVDMNKNWFRHTKNQRNQIFIFGVAAFVLAMSAAVMVSYRQRKQSEDGH
nr:putative stress up-regulated Nod 19 [Tanacetum cinerariifolium]